MGESGPPSGQGATFASARIPVFRPRYSRRLRSCQVERWLSSLGWSTCSEFVSSSAGVAFVLTVRFNDLSELEQLGKRMDTDQAFRDFLIKLGTLSRIPPKTELLEMLVPLPN